MNSRLPRLFCLSLPLLLACSESTTGPCDREPACEVDGIDLAIQDARVAWTTDQPVHPELGEHLVQPGDEVSLVVEIVNRGDAVSEPQTGFIVAGLPVAEFAVPALGPGERHEAEVEIVAPSWPSSPRLQVEASFVERTGNGAWNLWEGDAVAANNNFVLPPIHLAFPEFQLSIEAPDTVRALEPFHVTVDVDNLSVTTPTDAFVIGFCLFDLDVGCSEDWPGFGLQEIVDLNLEPGTHMSVTAAITMPAEASWLDDSLEGVLVPCIMPAGSTLETLNVDRIRICDAGAAVVVLPNVEAACSPAGFVAGDTVRVATETACSDHGYPYFFRRIEAQTGQQFTAALVPAGDGPLIAFVDENGHVLHHDAGTFTAPAAGVYYLRLGGGSNWAVALE